MEIGADEGDARRLDVPQPRLDLIVVAAEQLRELRQPEHVLRGDLLDRDRDEQPPMGSAQYEHTYVPHMRELRDGQEA